MAKNHLIENLKNMPKQDKITDEYLDMIAQASAASGMTFADLSRAIGRAESYIHTLRTRYPQLVKMTDDYMFQQFKEYSQLAQQTVLDLMGSAESETVRLNAAREFLSRGGYDAVQKVENTNKDITVEFGDNFDTDKE